MSDPSPEPPVVPFNKLTPAERERLDLLAEECAEVIQAIMKIGRHGYDSAHPRAPNIPNRVLLAIELGHLRNSMEMVFNAGDINRAAVIYHTYQAEGNHDRTLPPPSGRRP